MKLIIENVIVSIRHTAAPMAFFLFIILGAIRGTDLPVLFIGGLVTFLLFRLLGSIVAGLMEHMNKDIVLEPLKEEPDHEERIKQHLDVRQGIELPSLD